MSDDEQNIPDDKRSESETERDGASRTRASASGGMRDDTVVENLVLSKIRADGGIPIAEQVRYGTSW